MHCSGSIAYNSRGACCGDKNATACRDNMVYSRTTLSGPPLQASRSGYGDIPVTKNCLYGQRHQKVNSPGYQTFGYKIFLLSRFRRKHHSIMTLLAKHEAMRDLCAGIAEGSKAKPATDGQLQQRVWRQRRLRLQNTPHKNGNLVRLQPHTVNPDTKP